MTAKSLRALFLLIVSCSWLSGWQAVAQFVPQFAPGTSIRTNVRPITWQQYGGVANPGQNTSIGIFDTGNPSMTVSRETARQIGLMPAGPLLTNNGYNAMTYRNSSALANINITSGGWLGASLNGPEPNIGAPPPAFPDPYVRPGDPSHVLTGATVAGAAGATSTTRGFYEDFNSAVTVNLNGDAFLSRPNPNNNLVGFVDPINASPIPFRFDSQNGGNGRGLVNPGTAGLNSNSSSVSFFNSGTSRTPTRANNANPGFVHFVELIPMEFGGGTTLTPPAPGGANIVTVNGAAFGGIPAGTNVIERLTLSMADANNTTNVIPQRFSGLDPGYRASDAGQANIFALQNAQLFARNAGVAIAGTENTAGFVRRSGNVQVQVGFNNPAGAFVQTFTQNIPLPDQAPVPFGTINIPALGINTGATPILLDTGAVASVTAGPVGNRIVGTSILNRFGQYWDLSPNGTGGTPNRGLLTLIAPSAPEVLSALGPGMLFAVDRDSVGQTRTAVNHEKTVGTISQLTAGDAMGNTTLAGDGIANQAAGTVFRTHLTGSNATFIDEAAIGVSRGANGLAINAKSLGKDLVQRNNDIFFSVARGASPFFFTDVGVQAILDQEAADIFMAPERQLTNERPDIILENLSNKLFINQEVMGLGPFLGPDARNNTPESQDNLIAFDLETARALPGAAAVGASGSLSNLDSPITAANQASVGGRNRIGPERLTTNFDLYFSLEGDSDILRSDAGDVFARGIEDIGLVAGDDIDALALFRPSVDAGVIGGDLESGDGLSPDLVRNDLFGDQQLVFDPNPDRDFKGIDAFNGGEPTDLALFSLSPDSLSLGGFFDIDLSPGDLFITDFDGTFSLYATAESLGLFFDDNLDALDVQIPEPTAIVLFTMALSLSFAARGRRRTL